MKALLGDEWELQDPFATNESTIKDLISHRTGLPRNDWGSQASGGASAIERMVSIPKPSPHSYTTCRSILCPARIVETLPSFG